MILIALLSIGAQSLWINTSYTELLPLDFSSKQTTCNKFLQYLRKPLEIKDNPTSTDPLQFNCPFALDRNAVCRGSNEICKLAQLVPSDWYCSIFETAQCSGFSECLTDECGCGKVYDVFKCADGVGCIARTNLCDGIKDCRDGSDECMCEDIITCHNGLEKFCVPREKYAASGDLYTSCKGPEKLEKDISTAATNSELLKCLVNIYESDLRLIGGAIPAWCTSNCDSDFSHFCANLFLGWGRPRLLQFRCQTNTDDINNIEIFQICDGNIDCQDGIDEKDCPGRYYCATDKEKNKKGTLFWVDSSLICNRHRDCPLGDDECQDCRGNRGDMDDGLASDAQMIQSMPLRVLIITESVLITVLNIIAVWDIFTRKTESRSAQVDRLTLLSLCAYDSLMGLHLGCVFVQSINFSGEYCLRDYQWRSSLLCKVLGVIFTLSAHGSLLMISMVSLTRWCKCVLGREISLRVATLVLCLLHFINIAHSILPIIPISALQDVFRSYMSFSKNPFFKEYEADELVRKYQVYFGLNATLPSTFTMLEQLNNVSTGGEMFVPDVELGYYSYSSLCIHNIYSHQRSLLVYRIPYIIAIVILVAITSASYIGIVRHAYKTSSNVNQMAANANRGRNTSKDLTVKVMLMIGSQLTCWIAVMILTLVFSSMVVAPPLLYEITVVMVFPLNSYLNPIFNSFLYKKIIENVDLLIKYIEVKITALRMESSEEAVAGEIEIELYLSNEKQ